MKKQNKTDEERFRRDAPPAGEKARTEERTTGEKKPNGEKPQPGERPKKKGFRELFDLDYLRAILIGAVAAVFLLGAVYYVCWHAADGFSEKVAVLPALRATALDTEDKVAYYFRNETLLTCDYTGAVDPEFADGTRVGAGELLLTAYQNPDSAPLTASLRALDARIAVLKESEIGERVSLTYTKTLENKIAASLGSLRSRLASGSYGEALGYTDSLLVLLNRQELIFSSRTNYHTELAALLSERAQLEASLSGERKKLYAPEAGYFYLSCDGAETIFTEEALEGLTPSGLDALAAQLAVLRMEKTQAVAKLAPGRKWYLAFTVDAATLTDYKIGEYRDVIFSDYGDYTLTMKLEQSAAEGDRGLLIYSSERLPAALKQERTYAVSLVRHSYTGLRVPVGALRYLDGYTGVYARFGNTVLFRVVDVLGIVNGYAYVDENTEPIYELTGEVDEDGEPVRGDLRYGALGLYDQVITSGIGLYHGLIID